MRKDWRSTKVTLRERSSGTCLIIACRHDSVCPCEYAQGTALSLSAAVLHVTIQLMWPTPSYRIKKGWYGRMHPHLLCQRPPLLVLPPPPPVTPDICCHGDAWKKGAGAWEVTCYFSPHYFCPPIPGLKIHPALISRLSSLASGWFFLSLRSSWPPHTH